MCFCVLMLGVKVKKDVIVTISSDKGLCGGINSTSVKISKAMHKLNAGISWSRKLFVSVLIFPNYECINVISSSSDCPRS